MQRRALAAVLLLTLTVGPTWADCVDQAIPELAAGAHLTILKTDGTRVRGTLVRAESPRWILEAMPAYARRPPRRIELASTDIERIEAEAPRRMSAKRFVFTVLSGLALGAVVGSLVPEERSYGFAAESTAPDPWLLPEMRYGERHVNRWAAGGTAVGILAACAIAPVRQRPRTWSCADPAPSDSSR